MQQRAPHLQQCPEPELKYREGASVWMPATDSPAARRGPSTLKNSEIKNIVYLHLADSLKAYTLHNQIGCKTNQSYITGLNAQTRAATVQPLSSAALQDRREADKRIRRPPDLRSDSIKSTRNCNVASLFTTDRPCGAIIY